eukprot:TRINITY_DN55129_c0_g1_i1.p2 TRINITY_DN55129_c0_g1~~TRINITY_DN55129_c0_g1_i1.p2  ORF type:complete len:135 (+),score=7.73 TRINITY_DN55129_c0_g1_i1:28-405(+)
MSASSSTPSEDFTYVTSASTESSPTFPWERLVRRGGSRRIASNRAALHKNRSGVGHEERRSRQRRGDDRVEKQPCGALCSGKKAKRSATCSTSLVRNSSSLPLVETKARSRCTGGTNLEHARVPK